MAETALVSSCLLGLATRYDGTDNYCQAIIDYLKSNNLIAIPVCPEQLAGLPTPRKKCWFTAGDGDAVLNGNGKICDEAGQEVTETFYRAATETYKIATISNCKLAILKQRSPSCGSRQVHQNRQLIKWMGVAAAKLKAAGLTILAEDDLAEN